MRSPQQHIFHALNTSSLKPFHVLSRVLKLKSSRHLCTSDQQRFISSCMLSNHVRTPLCLRNNLAQSRKPSVKGNPHGLHNDTRIFVDKGVCSLILHASLYNRNVGVGSGESYEEGERRKYRLSITKTSDSDRPGSHQLFHHIEPIPALLTCAILDLLLADDPPFQLSR